MSHQQALSFQHLNQFFDHIYVISLKRAHDRHARLETALQGLNWSYFWGTDKLDLTPDHLAAEALYDDDTHRRIKRTHRSMSTGEIACALSHRRIYQDVLDKGYRKALILEDDVAVLPHGDSHFGQAMTTLPRDWELLMLGYYSEKYRHPFHLLQRQVYLLYHHLKISNWQKVDKRYIKNMLMKPINRSWYQIGKLVGGHSYAVSHSACKKFIDLQTPIVLQADRIFSHASLLGNLKGYGIRQKVFGLSELAEHSYIEYPSLLQKVGAFGQKARGLAPESHFPNGFHQQLGMRKRQ